MPNWCYNYGTFTHSDPDMVRQLVVALEREVFFKTFAPCPEELLALPADLEENAHLKAKYNHSNWYEWCTAEWGTKWDASDVQVSETSETSVTASFNTAWSPPIALYEKLVKMGWEVDADYEEEGQSFRGYFTNEEGDECYSYDFSTFKKGWEKNFPERVLGAGLREEYKSWLEDQKSANTA